MGGLGGFNNDVSCILKIGEFREKKENRVRRLVTK